jgi:hypothetical protein
MTDSSLTIVREWAETFREPACVFGRDHRRMSSTRSAMTSQRFVAHIQGLLVRLPPLSAPTLVQESITKRSRASGRCLELHHYKITNGTDDARPLRTKWIHGSTRHDPWVVDDDYRVTTNTTICLYDWVVNEYRISHVNPPRTW